MRRRVVGGAAAAGSALVVALVVWVAGVDGVLFGHGVAGSLAMVAHVAWAGVLGATLAGPASRWGRSPAMGVVLFLAGMAAGGALAGVILDLAVTTPPTDPTFDPLFDTPSMGSALVGGFLVGCAWLVLALPEVLAWSIATRAGRHPAAIPHRPPPGGGTVR